MEFKNIYPAGFTLIQLFLFLFVFRTKKKILGSKQNFKFMMTKFTKFCYEKLKIEIEKAAA